MNTENLNQTLSPNQEPLRPWVTPVFARLNLKDALTGDGGLFDGELEPNAT